MRRQQRIEKNITIVLLIFAVVVTGAFIGTTSKYVTSNTDFDSAVAGKFGLNTANAINLFSDSYTNVAADTNGKKVIAPGTTGHYTFKVIGTSEAAYKVNANITITYSEEWGEYQPLEFSLDGNTWTTLEQFKTDLSAALESEILLPNETYNNSQDIHWRWPFYISAEKDIKDTDMGVVATMVAAPKVTINIEMAATQVG